MQTSIPSPYRKIVNSRPSSTVRRQNLLEDLHHGSAAFSRATRSTTQRPSLGTGRQAKGSQHGCDYDEAFH